MSFTVHEFHDLIRLVEERPEWRAELRRLVLTDELLAVPEQLAELRAQTERQFQTLAAAQQRTDERLAQLIEAQQRTDERLAQLAEAQQGFAKTQQRLEVRFDGLEARFDGLEVRVDRLEKTVSILVDDMGEVKGQNLEMLYRQRAAAYLSRIARRIKTLSTDELANLLDDAVDRNQLSDAERDEILLADLVVQGRRRDDGTEVYLVIEISSGVGPHDVERAVHRAILLTKLGTPALPVVAGKTITQAATRLAQAQQVWQVTNGYAASPASD